MKISYPLTRGEVSAFTIPTEQPESDGTIDWKSTTIVVVEMEAGGKTGLGFTYSHRAAAELIHDKLFALVLGKSALDTQLCWDTLTRAVRNIGRPGLGTMAIAAVDSALWDLKAKLLGLPLHRLLGAVRAEVPIYGSGGFTSYSIGKLKDQLGTWVQAGISKVKMKVGTNASEDEERVRQARAAIGAKAELFVDANGAYDRKQALAFARSFAAQGVSWFEEPVSSDDLEGLRLLRDRCPGGMRIAAGEYGFDGPYFRHMLETGAVDVLQADATRCSGITGFLEAIALAKAWHTPLSSHCAPSMHLALGCHSSQIAHLEYFHDHVRIERMLFDGAIEPKGGALGPDDSRPGFGLVLKKKDVAAFAA